MFFHAFIPEATSKFYQVPVFIWLDSVYDADGRYLQRISILIDPCYFIRTECVSTQITLSVF